MPDILDSTGLTIKTRQEIFDELKANFQGIYGSDINLDSNSPDGQLLQIITQQAIDIRQIIQDVYNSYSRDKATGVVLDERLSLTLDTRQGATFTIVPIDVTVNATVTLSGLDSFANEEAGIGYTISDDNGNNFILLDTTTLTAGTTSLNFRAENIGQQLITLNTITNQVDKIIGVVSVNNSQGALIIGQDSESDFDVRIRTDKTDFKNAQNWITSIQSAILSLDGVTDCKAYDNQNNTTDTDGILPHGIWVIAEGGANSEIADVIYSKITANPMKGSVSVDITQSNGLIKTIKFDRPTAENLYIKFNIQTIESGFIFNESEIKQYIVDNLIFKIGQYADTASLTKTALDGINANGGGGLPVNLLISTDGVNWVSYLATATKDKQFTLDVTRITTTIL